ncbi:MAG: bifunctional chorismate mutase/prephenate dehydratase [Tractidigestivibacter sp.]|jgi:chorismate mutase/prephenate dehydratase|uniref:bifunctional chorismate mutase/prephenate dehydratase n=1 Tax=Tractidigestivibacter sp. TaxID=2847320 RepID=UPI003D92876F
MEDLSSVRAEIDSIDKGIVELFEQRMECADKVGAYKAAHNLPILDRGRERQHLSDIAQSVPDDLRTYTEVLFQLLMEASRERQGAKQPNEEGASDLAAIDAAVASTPELFPRDAYVACQGVEGAYSQFAAERIFKHPNISYFESFEAVFRAVETGFSRYGVLPIENSTAGSVNKVYDLMMEHNFHVVRTTRVKIDHNLLGKPGAKAEDIREVYSHEQAINQCAEFLERRGIKTHVCENTAMAAKLVAQSDRTDIGALSSRACAQLYGLSVLMRDVQDRDDNYTRFACISKDLEIYPGANRTSLMIVVNHEPGALYRVLSKFYVLDINIIKLESRPIPGRDFEFMFYFDIDCPVAAPEFRTLMASIGDACEEYRYLGSYTEAV